MMLFHGFMKKHSNLFRILKFKKMFPHKLQKSLYSINNSCTAKLFKMKKTENLESSWKKKDSLQKS